MFNHRTVFLRLLVCIKRTLAVVQRDPSWKIICKMQVKWPLALQQCSSQSRNGHSFSVLQMHRSQIIPKQEILLGTESLLKIPTTSGLDIQYLSARYLPAKDIPCTTIMRHVLQLVYVQATQKMCRRKRRKILKTISNQQLELGR